MAQSVPRLRPPSFLLLPSMVTFQYEYFQKPQPRQAGHKSLTHSHLAYEITRTTTQLVRIHSHNTTHRAPLKQVMVSVRGPRACRFQLRLLRGGHGLVDTMGQGLHRRDRHRHQRQRDQGDCPERGKTAWARREHSETEEHERIARDRSIDLPRTAHSRIHGEGALT